MNRRKLKQVFLYLAYVLALFAGSRLVITNFAKIRNILALSESQKRMPADTLMNAVGYTGVNITVGSSTVTLGKDDSWWDIDWNFKKQLTIRNLGTSQLTTSANVTLTVDTSTLGLGTTKLLSSLNDLRVVYAVGATPVFTQITRTINQTIGQTNVVAITFPLQASIGATATDTNYYLYYGNPAAAAPSSATGYAIGAATATFVAPFNGTTTALIAGGTATPTTATGAIRYSGQKSALNFDGNNDTLSVSYSSTNNATLEFWFNPSYIVPNGGTSRDFFTWAGCTFDLQEWSGSSKNHLHSNACNNTYFDTTFSANNWYHLALVKSGTSVTVYVNGSVASMLFGNLSGISASTNSFSVSSQFIGKLDELRISNNLRYSTTFSTQSSPFVTDSNTLGLYHFDENGDDPRNTGKALDASGNGNHGTITGAKYVSGLVGVDASTTDTGNVYSQAYASHQGVFIEEATTNIINNPSFEHGTYNIGWSLPYFNLGVGTTTFTGNMAKRNSAGPFAAGVMVQGNYDGTTSDTITIGTANSAINGNFYSFNDWNQGSIAFWYTPERVPVANTIVVGTAAGGQPMIIADPTTISLAPGGMGFVAVSKSVTWTAGNTYFIVARWNSKTPIDGTNYSSISVDNVHAYGRTSSWAASVNNFALGSTLNSANGIIEGLTIYRRVLFDGTYGTDVGNGNEISAIYNSGTGKDPTLVTGSWDVVFALPTNASTGSLGVGGTGQAWSHPHSSNLMGGTNGKNGFMMDGTYTNDAMTTEVPTSYTPYGTGTTVFTPNVAKRNSAGPFAAGVMVQGKADGTGTHDQITTPSGSIVAGWFRQNFDPAQGSIAFWITPEWNGNDGVNHIIWNDYSSNYWRIIKTGANALSVTVGSKSNTPVDVSSWVAGSTHLLVVRWDTKNTLDGTNYIDTTIDNVHSFSRTTAPLINSTDANPFYIGSYNAGDSGVNAIIEGLTIYRRVLYESTTPSGTNVGNGDEISAIYNSGAGKDPTLVTGSWDVVFALPTNASTGSLGVGGTGQAWSHPHSSNLLYTSTTNTGGYMMNGVGSSDGWSAIGTGVGVTLSTAQKIFAGGYAVSNTVANDGWYRDIGTTAGNDFVIRALANSDGTSVPKLIFYDQSNGAEIASMVGTTASTRTSPDVFIFTGEAPAGCTNIRVKLINTQTTGTVYWHQVEVLRNKMRNPSLETGSGTFWTPTGYSSGSPNSAWTSTQESSEFHSGSSAIRLKVTNGNNSNFLINTSSSISLTGKFSSYGHFGKAITYSNGVSLGLASTDWVMNLQSNPITSCCTLNNFLLSSSTNWQMRAGVMRTANTTSTVLGLSGSTYGGGFNAEYIDDDLFLFDLDDVSLTVTPATQANSVETSGLRVDGADVHTQTISSLKTTDGTLRFIFTPRHSFGVGGSFGSATPVIVNAIADSANQIKLWRQNSTTLQLQTIANGTTLSIGWTSPTLNAGTSYPVEIGYSGSSTLYLKINNVMVGSTNTMGLFSTAPTTVYWGTDSGGANSNTYDATFAVPNYPSAISALATAEKIYGGGYKATTDLINSGISSTIPTTGGSDFVVRGIVNSDGSCIPKLALVDYYAGVGETEIGSLLGTVGSTRGVPNVLIFTGEMPGAGSKTMKVKMVNTAATGTCYWHQVEVLNNLVKNPSFDNGWSGADPNIPTGWTAAGGLLAGHGVQEMTDVHSGLSSAKVSATLANEGIGVTFVGVVNKFYSLGVFAKRLSATGTMRALTNSMPYQYNSGAGDDSDRSSSGSWTSLKSVRRASATNPILSLYVEGAGTTGYYDDAQIVRLDDVSLTATAASQANSSESTGLRVDGADTLTQPITGLSATSGVIKFKVTPRHNLTDATKFGYGNSSIQIANFDGGSANRIFLMAESPGQLLLRQLLSGTQVELRANPVMNAGQTYNVEISYASMGNLVLKLDGTQIGSTSMGGAAFGTVPTTAYFGTDQNGANQYDATFSNFTASTPSLNTTAPYMKFGSNSVKVINSGSLPDEYETTVGIADTKAYVLSAYVYDGTSGNIGGTLTSAIAQLAVGSSGIGTTFTDMGGGWSRLTGSVTGLGTSMAYGVQTKAGKTVYIDGVQMEQKTYATTYADGSLGTGYTWAGTANNSSSTRAAVINSWPISSNINSGAFSINFWVKPTSGSSTDDRTFISPAVNKTGPTIQYHNVWSGCSNGPGISLSDNNTHQALYCVNGMTLNTWYHIVGTWDTSTSKIYVNNVVGGVTSNGAVRDTTNFSVGYDPSGSRGYTNGVIADLRIYDTAIGASDVAQLYYQGLAAHGMETTEGIAKYAATGQYQSPVIDLGANGAWGASPFVATASLGTSGTVAYSTRTSADNSTWSNWASQVGTSITSTPLRYFQWKADLGAGTSQASTPTISNMVVSYIEDTQAPTNPTATALAYSSGVGTTALTTNTWYNYTSPTFAWGTGVDTAANGQSASGIDKYYVYLSTDIGSTPVSNANSSCYGEKTDADRTFSCTISSNGTYYLRLQTKDLSGNVAAPVTLFTYKFDRSDPSAPASVSTTTIGFSAVNEFTFYWPNATDVGPAGIAGYEYKTGVGGTGVYGDWQFTTDTSISGIPAYTEGQNTFYVRAVDNAGNKSAATTNVGTAAYYYNQSAPTAPINLVVAPSTNSTSPASTNSFTVTWNKPETYSGEIAKYYYCVNCTPSISTMTETTGDETVLRKLTSMALATQQGKNTFYLVAEDNNINSDTGKGNVNFSAYGSVDFYAATVAPGTPTKLTVTDASDRSASKWRLTLAWDIGTTVGVDHYEIYRSTDETTYTKVGSVTGMAYTDGSLTQSTKYFYKVKSMDNAGASSLYSPVVSLSPEGRYADPPSAGGVPSVTAGSSTATIKWSTGRVAFGTVEYGATSSYGNSAAESTKVTDHSIKVTGLLPGTTYHYRTLSMDDSSLVGYERSAAYSTDYTFTTLSAAEISLITVDEVGLDSATISWKSKTMSSLSVDYGLTTEYGTSVQVATAGTDGNYTSHLKTLEHSTTYHFRIKGLSLDGDSVFSQDQTFETITFPEVTAYVLKTDQNAGGTVISLAWASNVPISSLVEYQLAAVKDEKYSSEELVKMSQAQLANVPVVLSGDPLQIAKASLESTHVAKIENLQDGVIYIIRLKGRDKYGNEAVSDAIRYVTNKDTRPPVIANTNVESQMTGSGASANAQLIISWETDEPATTQVLYGQGVGSEYPQSTEEEQGLTKQHTVVIHNLAATTSYHLQIVSKDKSGNTARSGDLIAVTPGISESALDVVLKNLEDVFGFLKI